MNIGFQNGGVVEWIYGGTEEGHMNERSKASSVNVRNIIDTSALFSFQILKTKGKKIG